MTESLNTVTLVRVTKEELKALLTNCRFNIKFHKQSLKEYYETRKKYLELKLSELKELV